VKAILEEILQEEMTQHLEAGPPEADPHQARTRTLVTEIALRSSEQWALKTYLTMDAFKAMKEPNSQRSRH
jgi:hypothetical protein